MKKKTTTVLVGGLAATAAAAFVFWKKKKEGYSGFDALEAQLHAPKPPRSTTARDQKERQKPTPENGHVHDVVATDLPRNDSGSNFSVQGDVHQPSSTENNA